MSVRLINKHNLKLYPTYKMFSWDLLFYYAIIYLFLTLEKGLSPSLVLILDAVCQSSKLIFQLPCIGIIDLLHNRKSLILANILTSISILLLIFANSITILLIFNIIFAFAYNLKQLCESSILYDTIPEHKRKNSLFSKIDGIGQSYYYYLDSISALIAGFLFIINYYLPLIFCFICCCISIFLSLKFIEDTTNGNYTGKTNYKPMQNIKTYLKDTKHILRFIFHSKRLKCLLLYAGMFTGLLTLFISLRNVILTEINLKPEFFGVALAIIQFVSGIFSKKTNMFQNMFKNKTLTIIAFVNIFPLIFIGLCLACKLPYYVSNSIIFIWLFLYAATKGPFYTLIKRYLQSFIDSTVTTKVYGIQTVLSSIFATLFSLLTSCLLNYISVAVTLIIFGTIISVIFLILLDYMKSYVGLKPEEYPKSEIIYTKLK